MCQRITQQPTLVRAGVAMEWRTHAMGVGGKGVWCTQGPSNAERRRGQKDRGTRVYGCGWERREREGIA